MKPNTKFLTLLLVIAIVLTAVAPALAAGTTSTAARPAPAQVAAAESSARLSTPTEGLEWAIIHYNRPAADYGTPSADFNTYWGLHLWGDGIAASEGTAWTSPKPFAGTDDYGAYVAVRLTDASKPINYIVHKGNDKDTPNDRSFTPTDIPELWIKQGDAANYGSQAAVTGQTVIHYQRADGVYDSWGLHLWGDGLAPGTATEWAAPRPYDGVDDYGAYFKVPLADSTKPVNFIVHKGDVKDPDTDRSHTPAGNYAVWLKSGDAGVFEQRGAAENYAIIHYRRAKADYDGWGLHVWGDANEPGVTWQTPLAPAGQDDFGVFWKVRLQPGGSLINFIVHKGDEKDPGPDEAMVFQTAGYEIWKIQESTEQFDNPAVPTAVLATASVGDLSKQQAHWVSQDTIAWAQANAAGKVFSLHFDAGAGLTLDKNGIQGGQSIPLAYDPAGLSDAIKAKFPNLAALGSLKIGAADLAKVPDILKGQFAIQVKDAGGALIDATGLQIPGALDDLYTFTGDLGVTWDGGIPTVALWAPTAQSVKFHRFADANPATAAVVADMVYEPATGVWRITGDAGWKGQYYLFEVKVFAPTTGKIETNLVTDPYSLSLATNSTRSQMVDLSDPALAPAGWATTAKPPLAAPEDTSIYELHIRDFSVNDASVPDAFKGTYKAFTLPDSNGVKHLKALAAAGLTFLHLLPAFDIATIDENKSAWQAPDPAVLATYAADSEEQQKAVVATEDKDGFNWGYDPLHYTVPEGSYSTDPNGPVRIVEFREMVQALNGMDLRVVLDVVYNHTNASGQSPKSVLDRIVPGYYHRLNADGAVETSTCCANTASEHAMMGKLMVDSVVTWARDYKIDGFRFDLMGHHMVSNMQAVRQALNDLTVAKDGVDGKAIYLYGEGWNFGEVADNARGVNATQLNLAGTGIGTFNDRSRDAARGPSPFATKEDLKVQGFASGLLYDPNDLDQGTPDEQRDRLLLLTDQIRVGMTGNLANYVFEDRTGARVKGSQVDYNGSPAGYTLDPQEAINYVEKHDNQTLYDIYAYGLPAGTSMSDRVRAQNVGLATVFLGEGVPLVQAGSDLLRSKSFDRDSFNSGDWFNRLDFAYQDNNFGVGLPVAGKNQENWYLMQPLLAQPALKPAPADIAFSRDLFQELLRIRYSSPLFRLQTAHDVQRRLAFLNTGPDQLPGLLVMSLSDRNGPDLDPQFEQIVVLINANDATQTFTDATFVHRNLVIHPVQQSPVDDRVKLAHFVPATGAFEIPGRTVAVFVEEQLGEQSTVTFPGSYVSELGGADWDPADLTTRGADDNNDGVWTFTATGLPAGSYEFKAAVGGTWDENYGRNGEFNGTNASFTATDSQAVHFYYDRSDNYVASRPDITIPVVAGSFGDEIGSQDWTPANLTTWMKDKDGDGVYTYETIAIPPGNWEYKVALNEAWDTAYPGDNATLTVPDGGARVVISYNGVSHEVTSQVTPFYVAPPPPGLLVTFPGSYVAAAGLGSDWAPENEATRGLDANNDGVYKFVTDKIPAGSYEFKAAVGGTWAESYGKGGVAGGDNVAFTTTGGEQVSFYYDRGSGDNWVASRPDSRIPVLVGSLMDEVGGADWTPDHLKGWMKDKDGDGDFEITLNLPAGSFEYKVAINESWDENYGAGGVPGGDNLPLVVPDGGAEVTFSYDDTTHVVNDSLHPVTHEITVELPLTADTWVNGGQTTTNFNGYAALIARSTGLDNTLLVFDRTALPIGAEVVSATLGVKVTLETGAAGKSLAVLNTLPFDPAKVTYQTAPNTFNPGPVQPVAKGDLTLDAKGQVAGCDAQVTLAGATSQASEALTGQCYLALSLAGPFGRVTMQSLEGWPQGQQPKLTVTYVEGTGVTAEEAALVRPPVRDAIEDEVFYFVLPDRFDNGNPANDYGGDSGNSNADIIRHGFRPADKAFYHGGDFAGLTKQLDYLQNLGVTALWITPPFKNKPTQPDGSTDLGVGASYHGYWILDFENADPHLGTNAELKALVDAAQTRGMKVFFDIVVNHTADVITYQEGSTSYRSKAAYPYKDAQGNVFDDRDYAGQANFPALDRNTSFPYTPVFANPQDAEAKNPDWLNNPTYYHNRGNSTFTGENSLYGDFVGLDDTFTEQPQVVQGYIDIFKDLIDTFGIDGFRIDTVKHVNMELWQKLAPEVMAYAKSKGKSDFTMFGEVFGEDAAFRSRYTTEGKLPALLDFGMNGAADTFVLQNSATDGLRDLFATDDYYTDADSNAYQLGNFISNHDIGRMGYLLQSTLPTAADAELVQRLSLAYALIYFARGFPIVYYGDEQGFTGTGGDKLARQDMMPSLVPEYNDDDLIGTDATTAVANFDTGHPLFNALKSYAGLLAAHPALNTGAQIHRYSQSSAGIYAFSRIDRSERVEYVVALNNASTAQSATFATASPDTTFAVIYPAAAQADPIIGDATGKITVNVPALGFIILAGQKPIPAGAKALAIELTQPGAQGEVSGRPEIAAKVLGNAFAEVSFAVKVGDTGAWMPIGTDTNPPYRVFYDVSGLPIGAALTFKAVINDLNGHLNAATTTATVVEEEQPPVAAQYAVVHYLRPAGDYDGWGLHLWGDGLDAAEVTEWASPKQWNGEDRYGVFAYIKITDPTKPLNFIVHKGDEKDTPNDRSFTPSTNPEIWITQGDAANYASSAAAKGTVTIHYKRLAGDYDGWGLHLWGDAIDPTEATEWASPKLPTGSDDFGAYFNVKLADPTKPVTFIVHKGDEKDTPNDRSFTPDQTGFEVWLQQGDAAIYKQRGAVEGFALLHYNRPAGDYGDYNSANSQDFWGLHVWQDTTETPTWQTPLKPVAQDRFGVVFRIGLKSNPQEVGYLIHRGDAKDPGPDQILTLNTHGYEVWQLQGADTAKPYVLPHLP